MASCRHMLATKNTVENDPGIRCKVSFLFELKDCAYTNTICHRRFAEHAFLEGLFFHSWHAFWRYGWKKKGEDWRRRLGQGSSGIRVWGLAIGCQCHCRLAPNQGSFELWCQGVNRIYPNLAFFKDSFCFKFQQSIDFDSFWRLTILTHKHIRHHQTA